MDTELILFFTMNGLNIVRKGGAEKIKLDSAPKTLPEFIDIVRQGGAGLVACSSALPIVGCAEEDLIEGVECGGVVTFLDEAESPDTALTF